MLASCSLTHFMPITLAPVVQRCRCTRLRKLVRCTTHRLYSEITRSGSDIYVVTDSPSKNASTRPKKKGTARLQVDSHSGTGTSEYRYTSEIIIYIDWFRDARVLWFITLRDTITVTEYSEDSGRKALKRTQRPTASQTSVYISLIRPAPARLTRISSSHQSAWRRLQHTREASTKRKTDRSCRLQHVRRSSSPIPYSDLTSLTPPLA